MSIPHYNSFRNPDVLMAVKQPQIAVGNIMKSVFIGYRVDLKPAEFLC